MKKVEKGKLISLTYVLKYDGKDGEVIEIIEQGEPMAVRIGDEDLFEKIEKTLIGLQEGDDFEVTLTPAESYGEYDPEMIVHIPRSEVMADGEVDEDPIVEGNIIPLCDENDNEYDALILEVKDDVVTLDFNHPLAGETLYFQGKIEKIED